MFLEEEGCKEKIDALTYEDWQPLLELIPEIESTSTFGTWVTDKKDEEGVVIFPYCVRAPVVSRFFDVVYNMPIMIIFDWMSWDESRKMVGDENFDFNSIDIVTKCKLITSVVRSDRFSEGALVSAFKSGLILRILKSIEKGMQASRQ